MNDVIRWRRHSGVVLDSVAGWNVIECSRCQFAHLIPIPSPEELATVYRQDYYLKHKPQYAARHLADADWWNLVYRDRYEIFEELLPENRRQILDVGSGPSTFLRCGKSRGWDGCAIDPSPQAVAAQESMGVRAVQGFLTETTAMVLGRFDAIHMNEVLEHVADPCGILSLSHRLLNKGGLLCIAVPNDYSEFQRAATRSGRRRWWVDPPNHINYFNFESMRDLVTSAGFDIVSEEATFPIDMFLLMGWDYIDNDPVGRLCHARRKAFELALDAAGLNGLKQSLYRGFARLGIGRQVVVVARVVEGE